MFAESDSNITGVRINRDAASVAFNYQSPPLEISDLVGLIQSAGKVEKDWLSQRRKGETMQWRDGEVFSVSCQSHTHPQGSCSTNGAILRGLENGCDRHVERIAKLIILACSLEVRKAEIPSTCCLLKSKAGKPLYGGAKSSRIVKLRKLHVLIWGKNGRNFTGHDTASATSCRKFGDGKWQS